MNLRYSVPAQQVAELLLNLSPEEGWTHSHSTPLPEVRERVRVVRVRVKVRFSIVDCIT